MPVAELPPDGDVIVIPVLPPRLKEFVAVNEPPPENVTPCIANHVAVFVAAEEIVVTLAAAAQFRQITADCADEEPPVQVKALVIA